ARLLRGRPARDLRAGGLAAPARAQRRGKRPGPHGVGAPPARRIELTPLADEEASMAIALSEDIKKLVDGPNFAHLATLMRDGSPHAVPMWVSREGDRVLVGTSEGSLKARNARRDPRVALSIVDFADPYVEAHLRGRVVEWRPDPSFAIKDATSRK